MCTMQMSTFVTNVEQGPRHWRLLVFTRKEDIHLTLQTINSNEDVCLCLKVWIQFPFLPVVELYLLFSLGLAIHISMISALKSKSFTK